MSRQSRRPVIDIRLISVKKTAIQPHFTRDNTVGVMTIPAILIICAYAMLFINHVRESDFAGHVVICLLTKRMQWLIVPPVRSDGSHIVGPVIAVRAVPPSIVGKQFQPACAVFHIYRVSRTEIVLETVVRPDGTAESIALGRLCTNENNRLHIGGIRCAGIGYHRHILHILWTQLCKFLQVVNLASVDIDFRRTFAEHLQRAAVVYYHRDTSQYVIGCSGYGERTSLHGCYKRIPFHRSRWTYGFYHYLSKPDRWGRKRDYTHVARWRDRRNFGLITYKRYFRGKISVDVSTYEEPSFAIGYRSCHIIWIAV